MRKKCQFSMKSFQLHTCFDCDTVLVMFMPGKVNNHTWIDAVYLGFNPRCFQFPFVSSNVVLKIFLSPVCSVKEVLDMEFLQNCSAFCHYITFCSVSSDTWRSTDFGGVYVETGLCTCGSNSWLRYLLVSFMLC